MSIDFYWRIPTGGDKGDVRTPYLNRGDFASTRRGSVAPGLRATDPDDTTYIDHMADIARAAEYSGFYGTLLPSFPVTDDPWVISSALARETKTLRFMIAFQPGFLDPLHAARMSASFQRLSSGRLVYNIITGGGGAGQLWWGDKIAHDDRYVRTGEFLDVLHGVWKARPYDFDGRFFNVKGAGLPDPLAVTDFPEIYFSGSSDAAIAAAGRHSDYYLSWLEPFADLKAKFERVSERAELEGRKAKFAVRVDVLARPTEEEAWAVVRSAWDAVDPKEREKWYFAGGGGDSVGAARQANFRVDSTEPFNQLVIAPNLWAGFSLLRPGPSIGIVGDYANAAERLNDLIDLGVDAFILAGVPHLEEAYRVGEEVLPLVRSRVPVAAS